MRNGIATPYVSNQVAGDLIVQGGNLRLPSINSQSNFVQKTDENGNRANRRQNDLRQVTI